eukprot:7625542-Karenia_brevis.AAC.1
MAPHLMVQGSLAFQTGKASTQQNSSVATEVAFMIRRIAFLVAPRPRAAPCPNLLVCPQGQDGSPSDGPGIS